MLVSDTFYNQVVLYYSYFGILDVFYYLFV